MKRRQAFFAVVWCASLIVFSAGCGGSEYPEAKVKTPLDNPGTCHHCGKVIPKVAPEHLVTIKAAQYVVCEEKCSVQIKKWHETQFGK